MTPEIGPSHGILEMEMAMEVPIMAVISGAQSGSTDMTVQTTDTSLRMSLGKRGRTGRSMTREVKMAFSLGRLSRPLEGSGDFADGIELFLVIHRQGEEIDAFPQACPSMVTVHRMTVSPYRTRQEPLASCAILPVSTTRGRPAKVVWNTL